MNRRQFTRTLVALGATTLTAPLLAARRDAPSGAGSPLPARIKALIDAVISQNFEAINTDWDGSIQIESLLRFTRHGRDDALRFASDWFEFRKAHDARLSDAEFFKQYIGIPSRIIRGGPMTFSIYSANLGVAFPAHELHRLTGDASARQVCIDVADSILHVAARDGFGMLAADDHNFTRFAIPDTAYWATRGAAIAGSLTSGEVSGIYFRQAIFQCEQAILHFFDEGKGLVRTGLFEGKPGLTYWSRSQGWLVWAIGGLLRYLPESHPKFPYFAGKLAEIVTGVLDYQTAEGGLHVLVDDATTPVEVTGISMVVATTMEAMRAGWIPRAHLHRMHKAWDFILASVAEDGTVHNAYTGWAVSAERRKTERMDEEFRGYVPGIVLLAAEEMIRGL